jgi:rod shape determining protein RodA
VGEEQGFVGSFVVICLFLALLLRLTILSERQKSNFARVYGYCLAGILFFHFILNLGMTMGLMPIIGIPLPFISRGGSSLLGFSVMIGVMLKMDYGRWKL